MTEFMSIHKLLFILLILISFFFAWKTFLAPEIGLILLISALKSKDAVDLSVCNRVQYMLSQFAWSKQTLMTYVLQRTHAETDAIQAFIKNRLEQCLFTLSTYEWNMTKIQQY